MRPERIDLKTLYLLLTGNEFISGPGGAISGIFIANAQGDTLWVNSGCERLWGYTASELYGKNVVDLERKGVWKPSGVRKVLESRKRVALTQETGVGRQLHIVGTPIYDGSGKLARVINGALDISPRDAVAGEGDGRDVFFGSGVMREVDRLMNKVGALNVTVLLTGETGTGKGFAARRLHGLRSPDKPFVKVDCGAIAGSLLESELFGYEPGAFSGADRSGKKGLVETAGEGTLFLDEVGEIPLGLQSKFLRLIQDGTYLKVGGTREHTLNARVMAATHRDLGAMVESGEFRKDLYFRLNAFPIHLPPLRERGGDIPALLDHFRANFERRFGYSRAFTETALACLCAYSWPGNIRELEHIVERMMLTVDADIIDGCDLPVAISGEKFKKPLELGEVMLLKDSLRLTEENLLQLAWEKYGTTTGVAKALGIDQSTASRKLRKILGGMR